jgi:hypothetical protein
MEDLNETYLCRIFYVRCFNHCGLCRSRVVPSIHGYSGGLSSLATTRSYMIKLDYVNEAPFGISIGENGFYLNFKRIRFVNNTLYWYKRRLEL